MVSPLTLHGLRLRGSLAGTRWRPRPDSRPGTGLGFTGALTFIGLIREFLGSGTLFAQASNLLGPSFAFLEMKLPGYGGALLMILPPGGFAILGFLLAGKRVMEKRMDERAAARAVPAAA